MTQEEEQDKPVDSSEMRAADSERGERGLFEVLDELAGIDSIDENEALEEFRTATPEPFTPGFIDKVIASVPPSDTPGASDSPGRRADNALLRRRFWLRPAVLIPIALALALAAATPLALVWSGRNSTTELSYEDAQNIVFEPWHPVEYRGAAQGHISSQVAIGIRTLQECAAGSGGLAMEARRALGLLLGLVTGDVQASQPRPSEVGALAKILDGLQREDLSAEAKVEAMNALLLALQRGIMVLRRSKELGPPFDFSADIYLTHMEKRIRKGM